MIYTEYYMSKSVSHAVATREPYITPRVTGPWGDIGRGWYGMWYGFWHVMFIISYISTMPLIIHVFYESLEFCWKFWNVENFEKKIETFQFYANVEFFWEFKLLKFWKKFEFFFNFMKFLKNLKFLNCLGIRYMAYDIGYAI